MERSKNQPIEKDEASEANPLFWIPAVHLPGRTCFHAYKSHFTSHLNTESPLFITRLASPDQWSNLRCDELICLKMGLSH